MANVKVAVPEPMVTLELTWKEFQILFGSLAACDGLSAFNSLAHRVPKHGRKPTSPDELGAAALVLYRTLKDEYEKGVF